MMPARMPAVPGVKVALVSDERDPPRGWYWRGYLPHFDGSDVPQMITFHLADALPRSLVQRWQADLRMYPEEKGAVELRRRVEAELDRGRGDCVLRRPEVALLVEHAVRHWDGERYYLHAWVIMPTHVHVLLTLSGVQPMAEVLHSWKSYTSSAANRLLGRRGALWQREYFDRYVRSAKHFDSAARYIEQNPVVARLCAQAGDWPWGSAHCRQIGSRATL